MQAIDFPTQLGVDEAQQCVIAQARIRRLAAERVDLSFAHGRVLDRDVQAMRDVPAFANSAMDGFALRGADLPGDRDVRLRIVGTRLAGNGEAASIGAGECLRITTGAPVPDGADSVVIKERVRVDGDWLVVSPGETAGAHVRPAGEDYRSGETALRAGTRLGAGALGVLASLGFADVEVVRRPRLALITTGDELVLPGAGCAPGQIYNSNGYSLAALATQAGAELLQRGTDSTRRFSHLRDDPAVLRSGLLDAAERADVIVTSGGVSAGEADFLPDLLAEIGRVHFWKVRMRPGMPLLFGEIGKTLVFGLPGNPVSSIATFLNFVCPALAALQGVAEPRPGVVYARLAEAIHKRHDRTEFLRARLESRDDGTLAVSALPKQGSGMLRGVVEANALIVVAEQARELATGSVVPVLPLPMPS